MRDKKMKEMGNLDIKIERKRVSVLKIRASWIEMRTESRENPPKTKISLGQNRAGEFKLQNESKRSI